MHVDRASSSTASDNARPAGSEAIGSPPSAQTESPAAHLRNALALIDVGRLTGRWTDDGDHFQLTSAEISAVRVRIVAALARIPDRHAFSAELEESPEVARQLLDTIGAQAAAALTADLLLALSGQGYLIAWSVEPTRRAIEEDVLVGTPTERGELRRRRAGHASALEEMESTNKELRNLRLAIEGPDELEDQDRDATGRP